MITLTIGLLLAAQGTPPTIWKVDDDGGPGIDFTEIQSAIDAAADGDIVAVWNGVYSGFTLGKGLFITALPGASPVVDGGVEVHGIPLASDAVLRGLLVGGSIDAHECSGTLWIERCAFAPPEPGLVNKLRACDDVLVHRSAFFASAAQDAERGKPGLWLLGSLTQIYRSHFTGGNGGAVPAASLLGTAGGPGLLIDDGPYVHFAPDLDVFASASRFLGGDAAAASPAAEECAVVAIGGHAIELREKPALADLQACSYLPGQGTPESTNVFGAICPAGSDGVNVLDGPHVTGRHAAHTLIVSPPRELILPEVAIGGSTIPVVLRGEPGDEHILSLVSAPRGVFSGFAVLLGDAVVAIPLPPVPENGELVTEVTLPGTEIPAAWFAHGVPSGLSSWEPTKYSNVQSLLVLPGSP